METLDILENFMADRDLDLFFLDGKIWINHKEEKLCS